MAISKEQMLQTVDLKHQNELDVFVSDLLKVHHSNHSLDNLAVIFSSIDLVYVLSGRGSALKQPVDNPHVADPEDDYLRILKGIEIAKRVNAVKKVMVPIFYNGRTKHNEHIVQALNKGIFDYPKEMFIIRPIVPENTIGQAKSFKEFLKNNHYSTIALVSSAYHLPRISRTFGNQSPTIAGDEDISNLEKANLLLFGIDRSFKRPGIAKDLNGEIDAMKNYSSGNKPTIARLQSDNTFLNDTDVIFQWSFNLHIKQAKLLSDETSECCEVPTSCHMEVLFGIQ